MKLILSYDTEVEGKPVAAGAVVEVASDKVANDLLATGQAHRVQPKPEGTANTEALVDMQEDLLAAAAEKDQALKHLHELHEAVGLGMVLLDEEQQQTWEEQDTSTTEALMEVTHAGVLSLVDALTEAREALAQGKHTEAVAEHHEPAGALEAQPTKPKQK